MLFCLIYATYFLSESQSDFTQADFVHLKKFTHWPS